MSEVLENIRSLVDPILDGSDTFLVDLKIKPVNNIKLYLDADSGISIGRCAEINRKLYPLIEASQMFPEGDFSLEVSSPGIDEPLLQYRQYQKNLGRTVLVSPVDEGPEVLGVLKEVEEEFLVLEVKANKKAEPQRVEIPFAQIGKTVVQVVF